MINIILQCLFGAFLIGSNCLLIYLYDKQQDTIERLEEENKQQKRG